MPSFLLALCAVIWVALAIAPHDRQDWALENLLVAIALPLLAWSYQHWRFSNAAYLCLFIFFTLLVIGAAYLGTQGDVWDPQKDMLLAGFGAIVGVSCALLLRGAPGPSDAAR